MSGEVESLSPAGTVLPKPRAHPPRSGTHPRPGAHTHAFGRAGFRRAETPQRGRGDQPVPAEAALLAAEPPKHLGRSPFHPLLPDPHLRAKGLLELENFLDVLRLLFPGGAALAVLPGHGRRRRRGGVAGRVGQGRVR